MLQQFLIDLEAGLAPQACKDPNHIVWRQIETFEQTIGKSFVDGYTRQEYITLFESMNLRSASYFNYRRSAVNAYATYLIDKGLLSSDHASTILQIKFSDLSIENSSVSKKKMFYSLDELQSAIQTTLSESDSYDPTRFDMAICALYLSWFGFDRDEIISLLKTDVCSTGVYRKDQLLPMPAFICTVLLRYAQAEGYEQQAKGIIYHKYQPSQYLFRSTRLAQITDYSQLTSTINRFNTVTKGVYSLEYDIVRKSGILNRVYHLDTTGQLAPLSELQSNLSLASSVFESSLKTKSAATAWTEDYTLYKKVKSSLTLSL